MQHMLESKELNKANFVVIDPRMTRTAAHATEYVRIRPGTDIPVLHGMMWHILKNGWEDKEFIRQRVYGFDDLRKEVEKWTPEEVERVSGVPGAQLERVAKMFATQKPSTLIWCMGQTQHTVGTANVRASCIALLLTGNVGKSGTGANIDSVSRNVARLTDHLTHTTAQLDTLLSRMNRGEGTLGKLAADTMMYHNLRELSASLTALLTDLREHPDKYMKPGLVRVKMF
jgi:formate dehydrogenase major subunit